MKVPFEVLLLAVFVFAVSAGLVESCVDDVPISASQGVR
jgi:hypothetical protein